MFKPNSNMKLDLFNVSMGVNLITTNFIPYLINTRLFFTSLVLELPNKMEWPSI